MKLPVAVSGGRHLRRNPEAYDVKGTDKPWLFPTRVDGMSRCLLNLIGEGESPATYTVRLAFAELMDAKPGQRVFDIELQGKVVEKGFDIVKAAGGPNRALVRQFKGIEVTDKLTIRLLPKVKKPTPEQVSTLSAVEVVRERVLHVAFHAPATVLLRDAEPEQTVEVPIFNRKDKPFTGRLCFTAPKDFAVTPARSNVRLEPNTQTTIAIKVAVANKTTPGKYPIHARLMHSSGKLEWEAKPQIEYLGPRQRLVFTPVADAHVAQSRPDMNFGKTSPLNIDGGQAKMRDRSHYLAYLTFKVNVPGKPVSVVLRLVNAGNPSHKSGRLCLVTQPWREMKITYTNRPKLGAELSRLGNVAANQVVELPLKVDVLEKRELRLAIDPDSCDGVNYYSRESRRSAPQLIVEYEPAK